MTMTAGRLFAIAGFVLALTASAPAQEFPTKPVRIIVPFAPGGLNDLVGRMIATHLTERFGRQVIVENRTGAGGVVGTELVANSPKDGHTLLIVSIAHAVNPWLYKLNYDPSKSFTPIAPILSSQNALAVNLDLPAKSLKEFFALAKQQPGKIQYASGGVGGSLHLAMELFKITAGVDLLHVPFRGAGPAVIDVVGGHTKAINATISTLSPHIRGGKLRAHRRQRHQAQRGVAGRSDHRGGRRAGLRRRQLDRHRGAGRNARRHRRPAAQGNLGHARSAGDPEADRLRRLRNPPHEPGRVREPTWTMKWPSGGRS